MSAAVLDELLDRDLSCHAELTNGNSDHLTMALIALERLGATDARLHEYADSYWSKLQPLKPRRPTGGDLPAAADAATVPGHGHHYPDLLAWYDEAITRDGLDAVLAAHLPQLCRGLGGAAFHGLIRTAYALEHGRATDVAAGLAYSAERWQTTLADPPLPGTGTRPLVDVLDELHDHPRLGHFEFRAKGFPRRFTEAAAEPELQARLAEIRVQDDTLSEVAAASHILYRATGDFFALHTMTATHATRTVGAHLADPATLLDTIGELARAVAVAYVVIGTPDFGRPPQPGDAVPPWDDIAAAAVESPDEHVIKLAYTCREEGGQWADPTYADTAGRLVGLIR